jgi:hypothetical protein
MHFSASAMINRFMCYASRTLKAGTAHILHNARFSEGVMGQTGGAQPELLCALQYRRFQTAGVKPVCFENICRK